MNQDLKKGRKKQWYIYLGGGAVDTEGPQLWLGAMVLAKDWRWAAVTLVASWMLTCWPEAQPARASREEEEPACEGFHVTVRCHSDLSIYT